MIRPLTCVCMLLAGASGLYLYQEKHRTTLVDREIARTIRATADTRAQTEQLRADWAVLNEPDRLRSLADHFLSLQPMQPTQWVQWGQWTELAARLPAPAAPAAQAGSTDEDAAPAGPVPAAAPAMATNAPAASRPAAGGARAVAVAAAGAAAATVPAAAALLAAATMPVPPAALPPPVAALSPHAAPVHLAEAARAAPRRLARPEHALPAEPVAPHEAAPLLAAREQALPHEMVLAARPPGRTIMAPVLSAVATPMRLGGSSAPMVSRTAALAPAQRPAMMASSLGGQAGTGGPMGLGSAIGGVRGSLPPPTPMGYATPYTGDR